MTASMWRGVVAAVLPVFTLGALAIVVTTAELPDFPAGLGVPDTPVLAVPESSSPGVLAAVLVFTVAPLALRQLAPTSVLVVVVLGAVVIPDGDRALVVHVLAGALASYTVGASASARMHSALGVLGVATVATVVALLLGSDPLESLVIPFVVLLPAWLLGDTFRTRKVEAARREAAARRERHELELEVRAAAGDERRRVARELHDIVAHTVSVMVVQAVAARKIVKRSPDRADGALAAVEETGREAMAELRQFLGALDGDDESVGVAPLPGTGELPALVERLRRAGLPATLETSGHQVPLPASVDIAAFRIVQEALTNALRYAGGAATVVALAYEPGGLRIEVSDEGPATPALATAGAGRGLIGMGERARSLGGRFEAGPKPDGGFTVQACLPLGERHE